VLSRHCWALIQDIDFNGQDLKLGIGKFVSMGSVSFNSLTSTIDKPDCAQGSITGTAKIILRIHGIKQRFTAMPLQQNITSYASIT
jgi:hypothetical protein